MKISAKLAQESEGFDLSLLGQLAHALGAQTGGMIGNQYLDVGNCDLTMMLVQGLYQDCGDKRLVLGSSPSSDHGTFVVLSDGAVEHVTVGVEDGEIYAASRPITEADYPSCIAYLTASDMFGTMCMNVLEKMSVTVDGDEISGNMKVSMAEAIRNRISGSQTVVIRRDGKLVAGFRQSLDIGDGLTMGEAEAMIKTEALSESEIAVERKHFLDLMGAENVFQQKVGLA